MNREQSNYYNLLQDDLAIRGIYSQVCEYYNYYGIYPTGCIIHQCIIDCTEENESINLDMVIACVRDYIFEDSDEKQLRDGSTMRQEYFGLPIAEMDFSDDDDTLILVSDDE